MKKDSAPALSIDAGKLGRLYKKPGLIFPEDSSDETTRKLLLEGKLMPSVTNVLSVRNAPYLIKWSNKLVAQEAVDTHLKHPNLIQEKPDKAVRYFSEAANRERDFWGSQGTRIHNACEAITKGEIIDWSDLTEYEQKSVQKWQDWVKEYQPKFEHLETTSFGTTKDNLNYAGTSDFIATINGKRYMGDYKCVTNDTKILLADGSEIAAKDVKEGMIVVSWTPHRNLTPNKVIYAGDNGKHNIIRIVSDQGQALECTENHPIRISRNNGTPDWVKAEDVLVGDTAYIATGWDVNNQRQSNKWDLGKQLSPYEFGVWWSLYNLFEGFDVNSKLTLSENRQAGLEFELKDMGCKFNAKGQAVIKNALEKASRKSGKTIEEIIELFSNGLPDFVFKAPTSSKEAFFYGLEEVFSNKAEGDKDFPISLSEFEPLRQLQQVYANHGLSVKLKYNSKTKKYVLTAPYLNREDMYYHGLKKTKIVKVEKLPPAQTMAIEIANASTHVTNGFLTHNTNRSGLHLDVALQLAAMFHAKEMSPDNKTLIEMPKLEGALGFHISPKGITLKVIDVSKQVFGFFESLRNVWDFHSFEGKMKDKNGIFLKTIKSPQEL